ncbi:hypothetical protein F4819DRAFT_186509 [Hypoxylon fuscum]|nr:hypothetical protein F4819DRAFT_186509 [Hypoxylon fuscum]
MATQRDSLLEEGRKEHQIVKPGIKYVQSSENNVDIACEARLYREDWKILLTSCFTAPAGLGLGFQAYQKFDSWENTTTLDKFNLAYGLMTAMVTILQVVCYGPLIFRWLKSRRH